MTNAVLQDGLMDEVEVIAAQAGSGGHLSWLEELEHWVMQGSRREDFSSLLRVPVALRFLSMNPWFRMICPSLRCSFRFPRVAWSVLAVDYPRRGMGQQVLTPAFSLASVCKVNSCSIIQMFSDCRTYMSLLPHFVQRHLCTHSPGIIDPLICEPSLQPLCKPSARLHRAGLHHHTSHSYFTCEKPYQTSSRHFNFHQSWYTTIYG